MPENKNLDDFLKRVWNHLVMPTYDSFNVQTGKLICPQNGFNDFVWFYNDEVRYAQKNYMSTDTSRLNRHKVSAALMIAILKTKPIKKVDACYYNTEACGSVIWPFNESLAITVGLSVLRAYILTRVEYAFSGKIVSRKIFQSVCKQDQYIFNSCFPIEDDARKAWESELYHVRQSGAYSMLSMAHELELLEENVRLKYFLEHKESVPEYPSSELLSDDPDLIPDL